MTQKQQPAQAQEPTRYGVFVVEKYTKNGREKSHWMPIGVAFPHKDNKGFNLKCRAMPIDGELVIREQDPPEPEESQETEGE